MHYPYEVGRRFTRPDSDSSEDEPIIVQTSSPAAVAPPSPEAIQSTEVLRSRLQGGHALAPLYRAILCWPGLSVPADRFDAAFSEITRLFQTTVELIQRQFDEHDVNPVAARMLARSVAELVSAAWTLAHEDSTEPQAVSAQRLAQMYVQGFNVLDAASDPRGQPLSPDDQAQLAEAQALASAMLGLLQVWVLRPSTQRLYVGERTQAETMARIRMVLLEAANETTDLLAGHRASHQRVVVYRSVLTVMADLYRSTLEAQFHELSREILRMDSAQQNAYLQSLHEHPNGVLIDRTEQVFRALSVQCYPERLERHLSSYADADAAQMLDDEWDTARTDDSAESSLRTRRERRQELGHE